MQTKGISQFELHFPKNKEPNEMQNPLVHHAHDPPHDVCPSRPALLWCHANRKQKRKKRSQNCKKPVEGNGEGAVITKFKKIQLLHTRVEFSNNEGGL